MFDLLVDDDGTKLIHQQNLVLLRRIVRRGAKGLADLPRVAHIGGQARRAGLESRSGGCTQPLAGIVFKCQKFNALPH